MAALSAPVGAFAAYKGFRAFQWLRGTFRAIDAYASQAVQVQAYVTKHGELFTSEIAIEDGVTPGEEPTDEGVPEIVRGACRMLRGLAPPIRSGRVTHRRLSAGDHTGFGATVHQDVAAVLHFFQSGGDPTILKAAGLMHFRQMLVHAASQQRDEAARRVVQECIDAIPETELENPGAIFSRIGSILSSHPVIVDGVTVPPAVFAGGNPSDDDVERENLEELFQRYNELPPHPVSHREGRNLDKREVISTQLRVTEELLTLKGLYSAFTFFGGVADSFVDIIHETEARLGHKLRGQVDESCSVFREVLVESMELTGSTPCFPKFALRHFILPAAETQISSHATHATRALFGHFNTAVIQHRENGSHPSSDTSLVQKLITIFDKFSRALTHPADWLDDPLDDRTWPLYLFDAMNGTRAQREEQYADLTTRFIDAHMFMPVSLAASLEQTRKELKRDIESPERDVALRIFLTPFYFIAQSAIFLFEMIIVRPIEALLNLILVNLIKHFAVKINLAEYIADQTLEVLAGRDGERETELLDTLFLLILREANTGLLKELRKDFTRREINQFKEVSIDQKKDVKEFLRSLIKVVNLKHRRSARTIEQRAQELPLGLGEEAFEQGLDHLAPLLAILYKKITSKKFLEEALAAALTTLNQSLVRGVDTSTGAEKEVRSKRATNRRLTIKRAFDTTGQRLMKLARKAIEEPTDNRMQENSLELKEHLLQEFLDMQGRIHGDLRDIANPNPRTYSDQDREEKLGCIVEWLDAYTHEVMEASGNIPKINPQLKDTLELMLGEMVTLKLKVLKLREVYAAHLATPTCERLVQQVLDLDLDTPGFLSALTIDAPSPNGLIKRHDLHRKLLDRLRFMKKVKTKENKWNRHVMMYTEILSTLERVQSTASKEDVEALLQDLPEARTDAEMEIYANLQRKILHLPFQTPNRPLFDSGLSALKREYQSFRTTTALEREKMRNKLEVVLRLSHRDARVYQKFLDLGEQKIDLENFSRSCKRKLEGIQGTLASVEINTPIRVSTGALKVASNGIGATETIVNGLFVRQVSALTDFLRDPALCGAVIHKIMGPALVPAEQRDH